MQSRKMFYSSSRRVRGCKRKMLRFPFFNALELAMPIAERADEEICPPPFPCSVMNRGSPD